MLSWLKAEPNRNNALEVYTANELNNSSCPICNYSFTQDSIKRKVISGYNELYEPVYIIKSDLDVWFEHMTKKYSTLYKHFKEYHYSVYLNNPNIKIPKQINAALGILQQLLIYETSQNKDNSLRGSDQKVKLKWRKEHNMKKISDKYNEFVDKQVTIVRKLYKDYLLPTKLITEMLYLDSESQTRLSGFHGMIINDDIPKWLLSVTSRIIQEERN